MKRLADFSQLELAYQYCIRYPNNRYHYQVLGDLIHLTLQRGLESGIDIKFIKKTENPALLRAGMNVKIFREL